MTSMKPPVDTLVGGHTPVPWQMAGPPYDSLPWLHVCGTDNGKHIMHWDRSRDEKVANARFIVKAVNNHEALVESLQWALDELNGRTRYDEDAGDQQIENCYKLAEAALSSALSKLEEV